MKKYKYIQIILIAIAFLGLTIPSCMESVLPPTDRSETLLVQTFMTVDSANPEPLNGVEVEVITNENNENISLGKTLTNLQGLASFNLPIDPNGSAFIVKATYNNYTQIQTISMCGPESVQFFYDTTFVEPVTCDKLDYQDSVIIRNSQGSRILYQNTPLNIGYFTKSISIVNSNNGESVTATLPALESPFFYKLILLDGTILSPAAQQVVLPPGSRLDILIGGKTNEIGDFNFTLSIPLECMTTHEKGTHTYYLRETVVEPECKCEDYADYILSLPTPIEVGKSEETEDFVFTNELPCSVTLSRVSFDGNDGWQILEPTFPVLLAKGEKLKIKARFTPARSGERADTLRLSVIPDGSNQPCDFKVILNGKGCSQSCPLFSMDDITYNLFNEKMKYDTLSNRNDNYVKISILDNTSLIQSIARGQYWVSNPDTACTDVNVNVNVIYKDNYAKKFFKVSPTNLSINPGQKEYFQVTFTAPTLAEFQAIVAERTQGRVATKADSAFSIELQITSGGCIQKLHVTAVISTLPDISPIINLRAYNQSTSLKPDPENEVYIFGNNARTILKPKDGSAAPYPPTSGDIWIDVNNNSSSATPPQPPILKVVQNSLITMKLWKANYAEVDFSNVPLVFNQFVSDPNNSTGYSANPITNLNVGDVIAFKINNNTYALIYIRRVDNGTEQTSSKQSGIEFRSIYPIYLP